MSIDEFDEEIFQFDYMINLILVNKVNESDPNVEMIPVDSMLNLRFLIELILNLTNLKIYWIIDSFVNQVQ
jgi:hypothetical protein